jgi:inosose dehydratase
MEPIRVGLIGCGNISAKHVQGYSALQDLLQVVAVCDSNEAAARTRDAELGAGHVFTDHHALLEADDVRRMFERHGLTPTSFCAHANLLDPPAPWRYGTPEIIKAVRAAAAMGIKHVITTEGDPKTAYGHSLSHSERVFAIRHALYEPIRVAADFGITILLEPHGPVTDSIDGMDAILTACGNPDNLGINMDTGNSWLGGSDPVAFVRHFGSKIQHVHWKDLPAEMERERGRVFGCGMAVIPLGTGAIDIRGTYQALRAVGFDGHTTLEIAGDAAVLASRDYLQSLEREPARTEA